MTYLTDHRADLRREPQALLPEVRSIISVGSLYGYPKSYSIDFSDLERGWIARYAWGDDYHLSLRKKLEDFALKLSSLEHFSWRVCVDTAPLLERSYAYQAGLGWIGKNTCLINQRLGSWLFLGELLTTLELEPDLPAPGRCGTCTRCIKACPTTAIVPSPGGGFELDSRLCISYFTIELRDLIPLSQREHLGNHVFGCDICQDVCPWNRRARAVDQSSEAGVPLERMAQLTESEFRTMFRGTAVSRTKYRGFLRNVAVAMGNSGLEKFLEPLARLAASGDPVISDHAEWAIRQIQAKLGRASDF